MTPTSPTSAPSRRGGRVAAIVTLLAGAALLLLAAYRPVWFADEASDASIGLRSMSICAGGECRSQTLGATADPSWARTGMATFVASIVGAALAVALAGSLAAGRVPRFLARVTIVGGLTAGIAGAVFVLQFPGYGNASVGSSAWLHFAGAALITAGWVLTRRLAAS